MLRTAQVHDFLGEVRCWRICDAIKADEMELLPTDEDVAFYQTHGYYKSKKIFTNEELDACVAGSERYYRGERDFALPREVSGWRPEHGNILRKNEALPHFAC
ncbi:hypothetical protein KDAU_66650 [Dictyobacter aurantiacus]|uniref:Phytanoyl-CoA dioxygenase n=2 Tax=Dictyobacter aurantiacus TaxID=1936993 RepID=A0A401ZRB4_9CHLR|nr:hypothetical protein KDAU_66650 [Dictyobacter aurantiacus]